MSSATFVGSSTVANLIRPAVAAMHDYHAAPTPEAVAAHFGLDPGAIIKLDVNENPFGPPPAVAALLRSGVAVERYPDPDASELRQALAAYTGAPVEHIVAGNGSDELLDLLCRVLLEPGDRVITCEPTFGVYRFAASQWGADVVDVPRDDNFDVDLNGLLTALTALTKLVFLCSPNNPSGTPLAAGALRAILEATPALVALDEAYAEFAGSSFLALMAEYPNLCVLRTLSKNAGLAGLRAGYGIFPQQIAAALWKVKPPYNVNALAQAAGVAALGEPAWLAEHAALLRAEQERMAASLGSLPGLRVFHSVTNFLLVRFLGTPSATAVYDALLARGILVRRFAAPRLADCLRISAGTPEQNNRLLKEVNALWR